MENINWGSLGFGYIKTDLNVRSSYKDGKWGPLATTADEYISLHMAATCLHYGQEVFEGLKAYRGKDGKIRIFRIEENAKRMISTAEYLCMQAPSVEMFREAVTEAVRANERFIPPYGTGATLYIRPLLIGSDAQVGVNPAKEYMFLVFVTPVGPYYKEGFNPIRVIVDRNHDRAAPLGTGHVKTGGNYAASLLSGREAHHNGYPGVLYLDACEKRYIDECGAANFFAIRDGRYITPCSRSILPSITNMSLQQIAADMGLTVERRQVEFAELSTFEEAGACGTAAVISPIGVVFDPDNDRKYTFGDGVHAGPWCTKLYERLRAIQWGDAPDPYGWTTVL
ncbi:MAG: branched-chain amino acid aminotransferase [Rikenellaceae bacterium]|jgi:branched-chain amino acid aminotransferase|nr:branched-chain amino acid aminotransferase [Rikenellaceae bacterium]